MLPLRYATVFVLNRRAQRTAFDGIGLLNWDYRCDHRQLLSRVADALVLIRQHDPRRYSRIQRDVTRITLATLQTAGVFVSRFGGVFLDLAHVRDASTHQLALTIVHEATHARLHAFGVRVDSTNRARVERICLEQEIAFAVTLGYDANALGRSDEPIWEDEWRFSRRLGELRDGGLPDWYIRLYRALFRP